MRWASGGRETSGTEGEGAEVPVCHLPAGGWGPGAPGWPLARVRAPSDTTNGTSSSKGTSHSKGQRSSSSTYHRQRRHSDFGEHAPTLGRRPAWCRRPALCQVPWLASSRTGSNQLQRREKHLIKLQGRCMECGGSQAQKGLETEKQPTLEYRHSVTCFFFVHLWFFLFSYPALPFPVSNFLQLSFRGHFVIVT